jgi:hypothetical protein
MLRESGVDINWLVEQFLNCGIPQSMPPPSSNAGDADIYIIQDE